MSVSIVDFDKSTDGTPVIEGILKNDRIEVHIISYAAAVRSIIVNDRKGNPTDVALGFDTTTDYELDTGAMGAVVGRFANRIGGARFTLNGKEYRLTPNDNGNCLHSGLHGFNHMVFRMRKGEGTDSLILTATSADGADGFPGRVDLEVEYSLAGCGLVIKYTANTDAPTVVNFTNHTYFNLNGHTAGTILGHRLSMDANAYLEMDDCCIPTGRRVKVAETPMDFNEEKTIGRDIASDCNSLKQGHGYDHCYIITDVGLRHAAWLTGPDTGIRMETLTTLPAMHLYTANYLDDHIPGKGGAKYAARDAVCLEAEDYPDAPNHPDFPSTILTPDDTYSATTVYRFDIAPQ